MKRWLPLSLVLFAVVSYSASAAVTTLTDSGNHFVDDTTGYTWMDFDQFITKSFDYVDDCFTNTACAEHASLSGFRHATMAELVQLVENVTGTTTSTTVVTDYGIGSNISEFWSVTAATKYGPQRTFGNLTVSDINPNDSAQIFYGLIVDAIGGEDKFNPTGVRDSDLSGQLTGHALVNTSPVPLPAPILLLGSALLGLLGFRRKRAR